MPPWSIEVIKIEIQLSDMERESVRVFLARVKSLLITGEYIIKPSWKNTEFDDKYALRDAQKRKILKSLTVDDCIKIEDNTNARYDTATLFFFIKDVSIEAYGEVELVSLYLKMYIKETKTHDTVIVISFHEEGMYD